MHLTRLQSRTGPVQGQNRVFPVYSFSQGKTWFCYREPLFSLQGPCIHYRELSVRKSTQENPCSHDREWVCSVLHIIAQNMLFHKERFLPPLLGTAKRKGGVISNYGNYGNRSSMRNDNIYSYAWKSIICSNYIKTSAFYILL